MERTVTAATSGGRKKNSPDKSDEKCLVLNVVVADGGVAGRCWRLVARARRTTALGSLEDRLCESIARSSIAFIRASARRYLREVSVCHSHLVRTGCSACRPYKGAGLAFGGGAWREPARLDPGPFAGSGDHRSLGASLPGWAAVSVAPGRRAGAGPGPSGGRAEGTHPAVRRSVAPARPGNGPVRVTLLYLSSNTVTIYDTGIWWGSVCASASQPFLDEVVR